MDLSQRAHDREFGEDREPESELAAYVAKLEAASQDLEAKLRESTALLREMMARVEEETNNQDGRDWCELGCPRCDGALPMSCSFGCKVGNHLFRMKKEGR